MQNNFGLETLEAILLATFSAFYSVLLSWLFFTNKHDDDDYNYDTSETAKIVTR